MEVIKVLNDIVYAWNIRDLKRLNLSISSGVVATFQVRNRSPGPG